MIQLPEFKNQNLFHHAFIHRSYLNESKERIESNERLEFLGDSILSFLVSEHLYHMYPNFDEGMLTNLRSLLVNTKSLAQAAKELNFGDLLKLSKGEQEANGRENQSLLADSFEAFIGALFIDQGLPSVLKFLSETILYNVAELVEQKSLKDPKSLLQEQVQAQKKGSPIYKVLSEEGPSHAKIFNVGVYVSEKLVGKGIGKSKQEAQEKAAKEALEYKG
jgi:ribonuclease-3